MHSVIEEIQRFSPGALFWPLHSEWAWLVYALAFACCAALALAWMAVMAMAWTYGERKIAGFIQGRIGPNRVGPWGLLQPIADGIKLLAKEDVIPRISSRVLYVLAPALVFIGALLPFAALPFSERLVPVDMELALLYILAFEAIEVIGILMAGWAPGSKWSLYGGMRLAAQMLSYEIPMGLCVLVIVLLCGSLDFTEIVAWQSTTAWGLEHPWILGWAIFRSPAALLAFFIFYIGGLAATKRAPFDLPEAESELVAGYHTEYSGMRFAFFFMAEYASMYVICALCAILFLGGWHGPLPVPSVPDGATITGRWLEFTGSLDAADKAPLLRLAAASFELFQDPQSMRIMLREAIGAVNMLGKSFALYFIMIWVRWTLPRIRIDQVMYLCLKVLLPFALGCVVWTMIQVALFP
ncbi:MAG TPA: NADH-quinone oxidoreductase subunit NuoH [Oligoflexia bacterium]|nr:NADH-quinone oxidoreductase subunit NuoH [Oligoflexia bacterium]